MKKTITWVLVIALVCVGGYLGWRYRQRAALRAAAEDLRNSMSQVKVERRDLEVAITGSGTVQANLKKAVQPGVAGTISQVLVEEGDLVKAGAPLLYLTNDSVTYQVDQARLDLALAQQTLDNLTGPAGSKAKAELDVKSAETSLKTAEEKVSDLTVESPIGGEVWDVAVKEGDSVKSGQTIATIGDTSAFTVEVKIKQADVTAFRTGVAVSVLPGGDLPLMGGVLTSIAKEGTMGSKVVEFAGTVTISKPDADLRAGMTVNVNYTDDEGNTYSLPGTVSAQDRKQVTADVDGTVSVVHASEGDMVTVGGLLVALENNSVVVARDQAKNTLESARHSLSTYQSNIDSQVLKVESARVSYEDKLDAASKLVVKSPIEGKVLGCSVQAGDEVTANQTVVSVGQVSPLVVSIPVDELDVVNVTVGQAATIEVDALPTETFSGKVQKIAQEGTVQQGITNYAVSIEMDADSPRIGMSATASIAVAQKAQVLTVPVEALNWDDGQASVNVLDNGQMTQRKVKIGVQTDLYAEVVSGLNEGDTVVVGAGDNQTGFGIFRMGGQVPRTSIQGQPPAGTGR